MTAQELHDFAADHLYYELLMFHETAMGLKWRENLDADFALKNAFIESFTIHARVLAVFLYDKPQRDDDVTAEDYVKDIEAWRRAHGSMPPDLREVVVRTNKEIAHLTKQRRPPGDPTKSAMPSIRRRGASSACRREHDLDEQAWRGQLRLDAGADGRILRIHPLVPGQVVLAEQPNIGQPHLRGQRPRLIRPGALEQLIDPLERELGLGRDVPARVAGDPADVHPIAVGDGATDDWPVVRLLGDEVAFDRHHDGLLGHQSRRAAAVPSNAY